MNRYIVTSHAGLEGARLSLSGQWGNRPFDTVDHAREAAKVDAAGAPFSIELEAGRRRARP